MMTLMTGVIAYFWGNFSLGVLGASYVPCSLVCQYFIYEVRSPNEYYFYFNMGFSKVRLWGYSVALDIIIAFIIVIISSI